MLYSGIGMKVEGTPLGNCMNCWSLHIWSIHLVHGKQEGYSWLILFELNIQRTIIWWHKFLLGFQPRKTCLNNQNWILKLQFCLLFSYSVVDSLLFMSIYFALYFLKMIITVVHWLNARI
jgi:hypothetical protein